MSGEARRNKIALLIRMQTRVLKVKTVQTIKDARRYGNIPMPAGALVNQFYSLVFMVRNKMVMRFLLVTDEPVLYRLNHLCVRPLQLS